MNIRQHLNKIYHEQEGEHIFKPDAPYERFPVIKLGLIFSIPLLRLLQRLNIHFHPSILSLIGLFLNFLAGFCFIIGQLIPGAFSFFFALVFDLLDGPWGRLTGQESSFTKRFDPICDRIGKFACLSGLWYGQFFLTGYGLIGLIWFFIYYIVETYATVFLPTRFSNPHNMSFSVWEVSFLILFIGPVLNQVRVLLPLSIILLWVLYLYKSRDHFSGVVIEHSC
jgi:phosphatidylglycerophosphate synthase